MLKRLIFGLLILGLLAAGGAYMTLWAASGPKAGPHTIVVEEGASLAKVANQLVAAGAVESIFCILAIRDQVVPPTLNLDNPSEGTAGVDLVPHTAKKRRVKAVLNNSFGFGGTNASLVLKAID